MTFINDDEYDDEYEYEYDDDDNDKHDNDDDKHDNDDNDKHDDDGDDDDGDDSYDTIALQQQLSHTFTQRRIISEFYCISVQQSSIDWQSSDRDA